MSMRYAVVIERGQTSYGAYVPDLPGVTAVGDTEADVRERIRRAVPAHIDSLRDRGKDVPEPATLIEYLEV